MKIAIVLISASLFLAANADFAADFRVCTDDSKIIVDDVFAIAEAIELNPLNPPPEVFKQLLAGVQKLLNECAQIPIDLTRYYKCVDDLIVVVPAVQKLINDIKNNRQSDIIIDITSIALQITSGITDCLKRQTIF